MTIPQQLALDPEVFAVAPTLDEVTDDALERRISPEEALLISDRARQALEAGQDIAWLEDYRELREAGWPWRVAAYIAWMASPRKDRQPKTQAELANEVLGLRSDRVIRTWCKKNPGIESAISMMQSSPLFRSRRDRFDALAESASNPSHKNAPDRKLAFEMDGSYVPRKDFTLRPGAPAKDDLSQLSDSDLAAAERALKDE